MANWFYARGIINADDNVSRNIDKFTKSLKGFENAWEALTWLISRSPQKLSASTRTVNGVIYHLYNQGSDEWAKTPSITVLYTYDTNNVIILGITAEKYIEIEDE